MSNDQDFVKKVYRSIVLAWVIAMGWALAYQRPWIALSITLGMLLGTGILASYDWFVRRAFTQDAKTPVRRLMIFGLIKLPILAGVLYLIVHWHRISLLAFCGGIVLVHLAMLSKMLGIRLVERIERDKQIRGAGPQTP